MGRSDGETPCAAPSAAFSESPAAGEASFGGDNANPAVGLSPLAETKLSILAAVEHTMRDYGISRAAACRQVGVDAATELRWRTKVEKFGPEALEENYANCGRKPLAVLNPEELQIAGQAYVKTKSGTTALRKLARDPRCRPEVADAILKKRASKHTLTKTLRDQLKARVPGAVMDFHRSPTRTVRESFVCPRTLTYLDATGRERRIEPGDLFERDDMSANFLFWIDWPWGGDPCSDRFGVRLARGQFLPQIDVGSLRFLSFELLVRLRDSYRADDLWQWVGRSYRDIGLPMIGERWERGTWQSHQLQGEPIEQGHTPFEQRLGGLHALGLKMIISQSPTTKIIENRFNFLQTLQSDIEGQIGRKRGEFEATNKIWTACRNGHRDPRDYFLSHEQILARLEASLHDINSEPVEGTLYHGVPEEMWRASGAEQRLRRLTPEQTHLFSRNRTQITASKGHVMVRFTRPDKSRGAWWFHHPDLWRHEGERFAVYFDREAAQAGATLVHADGRRANQVLGHAAHVDGCPQFALGVDMENGRGATAMLGALDRQKGFKDAVRSDYRALGTGGRTIAKASRASDGAGRTAQIDSAPSVRGGDIAPAPETTKPAKRSTRPGMDFDADEALRREVERMEREAEENGEFLVV
ncbi:MAG TPA: hypothetical protein VIM61_00595 [Chthoniobacterales bacterium]